MDALSTTARSHGQSKSFQSFNIHTIHILSHRQLLQRTHMSYRKQMSNDQCVAKTRDRATIGMLPTHVLIYA